AFDGKKFIHSPAFPAVVKNTAGAGDAFNGSLASGLAKGKSLESALCYASAFASLAVETSNALMNPLMILVKIIKLRWIHILSYDQ
ncbi:PfkB family carbohydrate kinase, partial [Escherichia coli]|uniref:PfkB family carbohydrate kinase n=1 Tax=Escherichia coli TaxID=562 RepID=UPI00201D20C0